MIQRIKLFNSLTHKEETLTTIDPNHLKMYVCGPTVYDRPHLGNARSIVIYDLLFRFLKTVFPTVTYVRNITDVDDKINAAAKEQKISIHDLTAKICNLFYEDINNLNVLHPTFEPRATEHISEMIEMIQQLITNGCAYENQRHVLFDVSSYKDYGRLTNRHLDEMIAGARIEVADYKTDPLDFVLWKPASENDDASSIFESPWGKGRPGWHIECSAMSKKYLGTDFDIHGGGADLQFPHHENEIAQSRCADPGSHFARFWIHNGFLTVNGEKMSKSLKNFVTVRELLDKGISGAVIRFLLLSSHYRKPLDFNEEALKQATKTIEKFYSVLSADDVNNFDKIDVAKEVLEYLAEDLNISKVIALLHEMVKKIKSTNSAQTKKQLAASLDLLGLIDVNFLNKNLLAKKPLNSNQTIDEDFINSQIELRLKCKQEKDFFKADQIRNDLLQLGILIEDLPGNKSIWSANGI